MTLAAQAQDRRRRIVRVVAVVALAILALGHKTPDIAFYWLPRGDFGIQDVYFHGRPFITDVTVKELIPHSAATDAGIHLGDRIELKNLDLHQRLVFLGSPQPGEALPVRLVQNGKHRFVTLVARPKYMSGADIRRDIRNQVSEVLCIVLGATLVLLRPARMTWLFYLWMVTIGGGSTADYFLSLPSWLFVALSLPIAATDLVPTISLFCLVFPNDEPTGWRRRALPFLWAAFWILIAVALARFVGVLLMLDFNLTGGDWLPQVEDIIDLAIGTAALLTAFVESRGQDRVRIRVVVFVVISGFLAEIGLNVQQLLAQGTPPPLFWTYFGQYGQWFIIIAFAYAIFRHNMFDIEFVLSRTLVYSLLALAALAIFLAIDFLFTSLFHGSKAELAVDIAVALGIGFWVRAIQGYAIDFVDRALFRRRYDSRTQLKAALAAVATADSTRAVEQILTEGAATALGLSSAVFFRRVADGGFLREGGIGWPADALWHLLPDDKLAMALAGKAQAIDLYALGWAKTFLAPPLSPVYAIPVQSGRRVIGATLYGMRLNGVLPSPDEVSGLVELARRAASTYLVLDSMRSGVTTLELAAARRPH
jgi:hypothetical protein